MSSWQLATVTLNGTLDRVILVPDLALGQIHSAESVVTLAGGKGINVARTAHALGAELMATGLVAGQCGQWICALLEQEGIPGRFIPLSQGESRISTIIVDSNHGQTTVINDRGPEVSADMWPGIRSQLGAVVEGVPWVALCGSSPSGLPNSVYADLCNDIQAHGQRVCLDARGQWLAEALAARPYLVKCNRYEAAQVLGVAICTPKEALRAIQPWVELGIECVVVTLGSDGAVAVENGGSWYVKAPRTSTLCPVGSGDAMLAGLIAAMARDDPLPVATQYGVALGTANTLALGSGQCDLDEVPRLLRNTLVHPL